MSSSKRLGVAALLLVLAMSGVQATQTPPPPPQGPPAGQPMGGSAQPGPGRGGRGNPAAGLVAQFCAACHGPTLQGGSATSLMDEDWKFGGDDASIAASIHDGRPGTAMVAFKDLITDEQIRQLVFYIRDQAGQLKGKPETKVDPQGAIIKTEKQTVKLEVVAKDLETPWGMAFLPDGRMLITERPGRLRILEKGKLLPPVTGTPTVWVRQDGGLFDVEVHPNYARNGWIYLSFSETLAGYKASEPDPAATAPAQGGRGGPPSPPSMTVIVRGKIRNNAWVDEQVIFRGSADLYSPLNFHYGSRFIFDREGHLFYSIGDKGNVASAQDLSSPLGKVHRINDDGTVPKDNPFVNRAGAVGVHLELRAPQPAGLRLRSAHQQALGNRARAHGRRRAEPDRAGQELRMGRRLVRHGAGDHQVRTGRHGVAQGTLDADDRAGRHRLL